MPIEYKLNIDSWKKHNPDYKIIKWDEYNYDFTNNIYMKQAYKQKKYSFATDIASLDILFKHENIYFHADVEVLKNLGDLLYHKAFWPQLSFHTLYR